MPKAGIDAAQAARHRGRACLRTRDKARIFGQWNLLLSQSFNLTMMGE